jgi:hypothetical protein
MQIVVGLRGMRGDMCPATTIRDAASLRILPHKLFPQEGCIATWLLIDMASYRLQLLTMVVHRFGWRASKMVPRDRLHPVGDREITLIIVWPAARSIRHTQCARPTNPSRPLPATSAHRRLYLYRAQHSRQHRTARRKNAQPLLPSVLPVQAWGRTLADTTRTRNFSCARHGENLTGVGAPLAGRALAYFFLCDVQIHASGVAMKSEPRRETRAG